MADDLVFLYDFYQSCFPVDSNGRIILLQTNDFETLDDKKFIKRYRLSKKVVLRLLGEVRT